MEVRPATGRDLPAIRAIYNDAVLKTTATFDVAPRSADEQQAWFAAHDGRHPVLVAEDEGSVIGWAALSRWSDRCAYADTAEVSVYVAEERRGYGVGTQLLRALVAKSQEVGLHTLVARVAEGNEASVRLHRRAGFQHVGVMREVGRKFGRWLDVYLMQLLYPNVGGRTKEHEEGDGVLRPSVQ